MAARSRKEYTDKEKERLLGGRLDPARAEVRRPERHLAKTREAHTIAQTKVTELEQEISELTAMPPVVSNVD